ncbi:MAG: hypothetical protein IJQ68_06300 [Methanobrevibacter sp.]|uniref:hypothetical protein n=1 Tax=Methanobrevibacter sp. TaxID=66852 RepID=UPI0025F3A8B6|nr:hypothetical protein [Methanobrevibacter sp.]MBR0271583.1 hypothetical protein [Methanobrevibacter sp.]
MNIDKQRMANLQKAFNSIVIGTVAGLATYAFFLYFNIAIFGWNLGLLFAPLVAGYAETFVANKLIGENIGAISAFILFIVTVVYGFIIANPTLGYNIITIGSIAIIIQAAIPTFINYFIIVVIFGTLSYLTGFFKKILDKIKYTIFPEKKKEDIIDTVPLFNERESNELINSQDFIYITSTDPIDLDYEIIGFFYTTSIASRNTRIIKLSPEKIERQQLNDLKKGKDECLIRLADKIKSSGGNAVIDLDIVYFLNGLGGSDFQIIARGMGVKIKEEHPTS